MKLHAGRAGGLVAIRVPNEFMVILLGRQTVGRIYLAVGDVRRDVQEAAAAVSFVVQARTDENEREKKLWHNSANPSTRMRKNEKRILQ